MANFSIHFNNPWLLLLLIPAFALTLIPYFLLSKKYRRTRNRIISMVLHSIVMVLTISVLAGIEFGIRIPNETNEVLILVDVSDTQSDSKDARDSFIETVIADGKDDKFQIGIVTFGFGQQYAAPLTSDVDRIFDQYLNAPLPDTSATDIASALTYAGSLFENPRSAKIVLVTDGFETDRNAATAIGALAAQGIRVDTAYISAGNAESDVQIVDADFPEGHIGINEETTVNVVVQGNTVGSAVMELWVDGEKISETEFALEVGEQTVLYKYTPLKNGLNELTFRIKGVESDKSDKNDSFTTYLYLGSNNRILILESAHGTSENLKNVINGEANELGEVPYDITVMDIDDSDLPSDINMLCEYDQVILNNIANSDMKKSFVDLLYDYVNQCGGGLFTVGGNDENGEQHAYQPNDMRGSTYQSMLPVQAIQYTPPVAVMFIIDRSGSMTGEALQSAIAGVNACVQNDMVVTVRDYVGVMTADTDEEIVVPLTKCINQNVRDSITRMLSRIESGGGTSYLKAINTAYINLSLIKDVAKKHVVIVSDGEVADDGYCNQIKNYHENAGVTFSFVGIGMNENSAATKTMREIFEEKYGGYGGGRVVTGDSDSIVMNMREELNASEIKSYNPIPFNPIIGNMSSPVLKGVDRLTITEEGDQTSITNKADLLFGGFYGTRERAGAEVILRTEYNSPLYAQWRFGKGTVGSLMCDLNGMSNGWSADLMASEGGVRFIRNVVQYLMPTGDIRKGDFSIVLAENNYTNQISVRGLSLNEGEYLTGEIIDTATNEHFSLTEFSDNADEQFGYVTMRLDASSGYTRCGFVLKKSGVYEIVLSKRNAQGEILSTVSIYKSFSWSQEYDSFAESNGDFVSGEAQLAQWATIGKGSKIAELSDPVEVFKDFVTAFEEPYDPRLAFIITAIVLFLLDIAVRKFKFKWIHEIIRERKQKNNKQ